MLQCQYYPSIKVGQDSPVFLAYKKLFCCLHFARGKLSAQYGPLSESVTILIGTGGKQPQIINMCSRGLKTLEAAGKNKWQPTTNFNSNILQVRFYWCCADLPEGR